MITYPKRLIEVDLPIKRISAHARREKSIRHGHISTLHIWWARRPLAACRAVICASLWPDPGDDLCPDAFRDKARSLMQTWAKNHLDLMSPESYSRFNKIQRNPALLDNNEELRAALLDFIADFANWDNSTKKEYLDTSRTLTQTAHEALGGLPGTRPLVVDPFAGGGAIPLEALRVGADAFASDLNPVAVLLNKVVLEYIPKYGQRLADEVRKWGAWIKEEAQKELAEFYPKDPDGATPIAYLWARTITYEGPGCGAEVPLMRSLWLATKSRRSVAVRMVPKPTEKRVDFEIVENASVRDVSEGTVKRGSATCPCCGYTTPVASVRRQLKARRGGAGVVLQTSDSDHPSRDRQEAASEKSLPLAYLITFSCYGAHLHGHAAGSVDRDHNLPGTPYPPSNIELEKTEAERMLQPPYRLDIVRARTVLGSIKEVAAHRGWNLLAAHVRSTHVHVVIQALDAPEKVMNDFKAYASRTLNRARFEGTERKRWTRHGRNPLPVEDAGPGRRYSLCIARAG